MPPDTLTELTKAPTTNGRNVAPVDVAWMMMSCGARIMGTVIVRNAILNGLPMTN